MFWSSKKQKSNKTKRTDASETPQGAATNDSADMEAGTELERGDSQEGARQYWNAGMSVDDWVSEMFKEEWKRGAFDDLAGKGKPIEVPSGDVTNSMLKQANFLPSWLTLQHEIRDKLRQWILRLDNDGGTAMDRELAEINAMIGKYNGTVPHHALQKLTITKENAKRQLGQWE